MTATAKRHVSTAPPDAAPPDAAPSKSVPSKPAGDAPVVKLVMDCLDDAKAEDTMVIDLAGKTSIADAMIITTGRSNTHVNAISDRVLRALKDDGAARDVPGTARVEGLANGDWVLIDAGDVIVHIFRPEVRQFYNLEKMWGADRPLTA